MAFWILNKQTREPKIMGSLPLVSEYTGLKYRNLQKQFSELKKVEFENDDYRIFRIEYTSGGKNR